MPKEFRMMGTEVYIKKQGGAIVLLPKEKSWATVFKSLDHHNSCGTSSMVLPKAITNNIKEFSRIPHLKCENWVSAP